MTPPKTALPPAPATQSKTDKLADVATTSLEVGIEILGLLSDVTKDVPYLGAIKSCIQKLINVRKACFPVIPPIIRGHAMPRPCAVDETQQRAFGGPPEQHLGGFRRAGRGSSIHESAEPNYCSKSLEKRFAEVSKCSDRDMSHLGGVNEEELCKRLWSQGDFPDVANSINHRVNTFRDVFSASRLITLSKGQDAMHGILQILVDDQTRIRLDKWLGPPADVAKSHHNAANTCHPKIGRWLAERREFRG
ncbi:hypothetical protein DFH09DRAFT_1291575 [Mycena vulgaris]|nr:hypothetical protein DFH09DRAFT_1291575 [Mycena vulgaris]